MGFRISFRPSASLGALVFLLLAPISVTAQSVTFSSSQGMEFGLIEYAPTHSGALTIGTNGSASLTGSGLSYEGGATPGQISIVGNSGIVEVKCSPSATLGGPTTLQVTEIEIKVNSGGSIGSGTLCGGTAGADPVSLTLDLGVQADPRLYLAGKLNIPMNGLNTSGTYATNLSGGSPVSIAAVFQ